MTAESPEPPDVDEEFPEITGPQTWNEEMDAKDALRLIRCLEFSVYNCYAPVLSFGRRYREIEWDTLYSQLEKDVELAADGEKIWVGMYLDDKNDLYLDSFVLDGKPVLHSHNTVFQSLTYGAGEPPR